MPPDLAEDSRVKKVARVEREDCLTRLEGLVNLTTSLLERPVIVAELASRGLDQATLESLRDDAQSSVAAARLVDSLPPRWSVASTTPPIVPGTTPLATWAAANAADIDKLHAPKPRKSTNDGATYGNDRLRSTNASSWRRRATKFRRIRDLLRVKGIGPRSLQRTEPLVVLDPPKPTPEREPPSGEHPEKPHVADQVEPAPVEEHRAHQRVPARLLVDHAG
jgi:hypothetical protein